MTEMDEKGLHSRVAELVDRWLPLHQDERFDLDIICRQLEITDRDARIETSKYLSYLHKSKNILDKIDKYYRYIDSTIVSIPWTDAKLDDSVEISWPYGLEDHTHFAFDHHIIIPQRSIIIIAGVSNMGKTTFALNFLWNNMDKYPCTLMGSEYEASQFRRRVSYMKWKNPIGPDNKPKFELIERYENWKDIIRPNNINIIDWINLGDKFYELGKIIEGIKSKLDKGICLICIQKDANKNLGMGGMWGSHLSSLYLTLDYGRITVEKAKEWNGHNPNREVYGFDIVEHGSQFHNIRSITACRKCYGKTGNTKCELCNGKGHVDKDQSDNTCWKDEEPDEQPIQPNFTEPESQEPF
jgi:hypothetical protein